MESKDTFIKTFPFVWIYTGIIAVAFYFLINQTWAISFVLGSVTSLMAMSMLYKSSKKVLESDKITAQKLAIRNYAFRYFFYALILVVTLKVEVLKNDWFLC